MSEELPPFYVVAWETRWVLYTHTRNPKATTKRHKPTLSATSEREGGRSFIFNRTEIEHLLTYPKPVRAQVILELPTLMGFRAAEITTLYAEHLDYGRGLCQVFDAKKHKFDTEPLSPLVGFHIMQVLGDRCEGPVILNESRAWQNRREPVSTVTVWNVTHKWAETVGFYPDAYAYSPLVGRRYFIAMWIHVYKLSLPICSSIVRHSNSQVTFEYAEKMLFEEDRLAEYAKFHARQMQSLMRFSEFKSMEELARNMVEIKQK
jgi:integrase